MAPPSNTLLGRASEARPFFGVTRRRSNLTHSPQCSPKSRDMRALRRGQRAMAVAMIYPETQPGKKRTVF
jgi:hypothetical protein